MGFTFFKKKIPNIISGENNRKYRKGGKRPGRDERGLKSEGKMEFFFHQWNSLYHQPYCHSSASHIFTTGASNPLPLAATLVLSSSQQFSYRKAFNFPEKVSVERAFHNRPFSICGDLHMNAAANRHEWSTGVVTDHFIWCAGFRQVKKETTEISNEKRKAFERKRKASN